MADRPLVVLHGWSDTSRSFRRLGRLLRERLDRPVVPVHLGDYVSMDDAVTFDDVVTAMSRAWDRAGLPRSPGSTDVIVHSTGGLVIRDWLARNFGTSEDQPVKRLLMLAPANFGSPLAHKGHSFLGRVVKGWKSKKMFQTGRLLLDGLELASPYQWKLAMADRFGDADLYRSGQVLCTVLMGGRGYSGIAAAANEDGSDGTVRVSTANMNAAALEVDFTRNPQKPFFRMRPSNGRTAFRVLPRDHHGTITGGDRGPRTKGALDAMVRALTVEDAGFEAWCDECDTETAEVMRKGRKRSETHGYQNTVFRVEDQFGHSVTDYFLEFYVRDDDRDWFARMFHADAIKTVHTFGGDRSYRAVYVDCTVLHKQVDRIGEGMTMSLTANPELSRNGLVGYRSFTDEDIGGVDIPKAQVAEFFRENRTVLVRIKIKREQADKVFKFRELP